MATPLARLLDRCGYRVWREYYVNDTGGQIRRLGESVLARRAGAALPPGGYGAGFIKGLAAAYDGPDDVALAGRWAAERTLGYIKLQMAEIHIYFDEWYSQASIEESAAVEETVALLQERGLVFEEDGATWLRTADFGDPREKRVLRRSDGEWTYLAGDIAYHRDKFLTRGFDRVIDVWGADHQGPGGEPEGGRRRPRRGPRPAGSPPGPDDLPAQAAACPSGPGTPSTSTTSWTTSGPTPCACSAW